MVKAIRPNAHARDYIASIVGKIGTEWQSVKGRKSWWNLIHRHWRKWIAPRGRTKESIKEPTFDTSGNIQSVDEHGDRGPILIINWAFFTYIGQGKDM